MRISPEDLRKWREKIAMVGRGDPIDGVYVLQDKNCVVHSDQDGNPVTPDDPAWNSERAIQERQRIKREKLGKP